MSSLSIFVPRGMRITLLVLVVGLLVEHSSAADPEVTSIVPQGVQSGTTTELTLSGKRLGDAHSLLFFDPGITFENFTKVDDNQVKVSVTVPSDYPSDLQPFRLVTNTGLSNLRLLGVGRFPITDEMEPNNDFVSPQKIEKQTTVHGVVTPEDVDFFVIDLEEGETITLELEGLRLAYMYNFFDPAITIYDSDRFELISSDDESLVQQDCVCTWTAKKSGPHIIEVRDSSYGGNPQSRYRLHVGDFPRPMAIYPSGGQAGELLKAKCIDHAGNQWDTTIQLPSESKSLHRVWVDRDGELPPSPNRVRVSEFPNVLESEPNQSPNDVPITDQLPVAFNGILETDNDVDYFGFKAKKDQLVEIRLIGRKVMRSPVDGMIFVRKKGGGQLAFNDDDRSPDGFISFKPPEDGEYVVGIRDHLKRGGPHFVYRIELTKPAPQLHVKIREQRRWISQPVVIPRGRNMAVHADIVRQFVGGDATLSGIGLPDGVTISNNVFAKNRTNTQLLFSASDDAPLSGSLTELKTELQVSPKLTVTGELRQRNQIVRGQNNRDVWGYSSDRLGVAVVETVPYKISVEQPRVPLVRNGSLALKVTAERIGDFKGPISLRLLLAPPGVSASGAIKIEKDQTEALIPLTANDKAQIGNWPITVIGRTYIKGMTEIASDFVNLDVADSLFDVQFASAATEQGTPVDVIVTATPKGDLPGTAEFELLGLPPGTSLETAKLPHTPDNPKVAFHLVVPDEARVGKFKTLVCRTTVTTDNGVIIQTNGTGEVQIDKPLPAVASVAKSPESPAKKPSAAPKPLSRLEKLRQRRTQPPTQAQQD